MDYCECYVKRKVKDACVDIFDELVELVKVRSLVDFKDELSDVCFGMGRLLGSLIGKEYVRFIGDGAHIRKIECRMIEYGCIRSYKKRCK